MKRIILVANDVPPGHLFGAVAQKLTDMGCVVTGYLGCRVHSSQLTEWIPGASFLLLRLSDSLSRNEEEVHLLTSARECGVPFGLYAPNSHGYRAEYLRPFRSNTSLLFVSWDAHVNDAQRLFPNATIVCVERGRREGYFNPELLLEHSRECA